MESLEASRENLSPSSAQPQHGIRPTAEALNGFSLRLACGRRAAGLIRSIWKHGSPPVWISASKPQILRRSVGQASSSKAVQALAVCINAYAMSPTHRQLGTMRLACPRDIVVSNWSAQPHNATATTEHDRCRLPPLPFNRWSRKRMAITQSIFS